MILTGESEQMGDQQRSETATDGKSRTAVLLIAHGSRRQQANDDLVRLAELVREKRLYDFVEFAYLELAEPTIPRGIRICVEHGAKRVLLLPYFLSAGEHAAGDLARFRTEAAAEFPGVTFELCAPLGTHPLIVEVVLARLAEAGGSH